MKKTILSILAIACLSACSRDYEYIDSGFDGNTIYTGAYTRAYLQQISDNLIIQNLQVLESMIALHGDDIWATGAEFVYDSGGDISGVTITKAAADSTWVLSRNGDYPINGLGYPTNYIINAKMSVNKGVVNHYNWTLTVAGSRSEDKGYACDFSSDGSLEYKSSFSSYSTWSSIFGKIVLYVTKDGKLIDKAMLEFTGDPFNPFYANLG